MNDAEAVLLPYQRAWVSDASPVKVCEKSRRVGLSWAEAADCVLLAAAESGMNCWYIGYNREMAMEFVNDAAAWARHFALAASDMEETLLRDESRDVLAYRIRFASGKRVTALSSRPSNLRGKQGKITIDEAAFHDDLPELLKAALALLMWGGRVAVISTHNGEANPFNTLVNEARSGKRPYGVHRVTLDDALDQGLYRRICARGGRPWSPEAQDDWRRELIAFYGDAAEEELFCVPARGAGVFLPRSLVEPCMDPAVPVFRFHAPPDFGSAPEEEREAVLRDWLDAHVGPVLADLDPDRPCVLGEDFARSGDLTVILPLQEGAGLVQRAPFVLELRNVPFRQQEQALFHVGDRLPAFRGAALDARGNGQYLAEVTAERYGAWRVRQVMLSPRWYVENMARYKAAFEERRIVLPADGDILDDHRAVRMERGVPKVPEGFRTRGRDGHPRHGDTAVAGALAWYAATRLEGGPVEFADTGVERQHTRMGGF